MRSSKGLPYILFVSLPRGYQDGDTRYPVVYVLDGDWHFDLASSLARLLTGVGELPPVIVVGIGYGGSVAQQRNLRARDYTFVIDPSFPRSGGAAEFLAAMRDDIVPVVERRYRTTTNRTVVGHSLGGLLATFAMLEMPTLFSGYVVGSAALWHGDAAIFTREMAQRRRKARLTGRLFLLVGEHDGPRIVDGVRRLEAVLSERDEPALKWTSRTIPGASHQSAVAPLLADGLRWILEGTPTHSSYSIPPTGFEVKAGQGDMKSRSASPAL